MPLARVRPSPFVYRDTSPVPQPFQCCVTWRGEAEGLSEAIIRQCFSHCLIFWSRYFPILPQGLWNWMHFPVPSIYLIPTPRAQVRWQKHFTSIATAGSLVPGPIIMPISASYAKPFQQPQSQRPQLIPPDFSFNSSLTIRQLCVFLHLCIMMVI